ncbi:MAG: alpha-L-rhamnosidase, partial [Pseudonocardiales bacterium]|nr:alpha-L-rhamnosidase [Pseudonocardiales bacterium]
MPISHRRFVSALATLACAATAYVALTPVTPSAATTVTPSGWQSYTVSADVRIDGVYAGILFRANSSISGYMWQLRPGSPGQLVEHRVTNNQYTVLKTVTLPSTVSVGSMYHLSINATGSTITTSFGGAQVDTITDSTYATGSVGVRTGYYESMSIDNLNVVDASGTTLFADDFSESTSRFPCATIASGVLSVGRANACVLPTTDYAPRPTRLTVGDLALPLTVATTGATFGWAVGGTDTETAYQIQVASSATALASGT